MSYPVSVFTSFWRQHWFSFCCWTGGPSGVNTSASQFAVPQSLVMLTHISRAACHPCIFFDFGLRSFVCDFWEPMSFKKIDLLFRIVSGSQQNRPERKDFSYTPLLQTHTASLTSDISHRRGALDTDDPATWILYHHPKSSFISLLVLYMLYLGADGAQI